MSLATWSGVLVGSSATGVNMKSYGKPSPATVSSEATTMSTRPVSETAYTVSTLAIEHASHERMSMYTPASTMAALSSSRYIQSPEVSSPQKLFHALPWSHRLISRCSDGYRVAVWFITQLRVSPSPKFISGNVSTIWAVLPSISHSSVPGYSNRSTNATMFTSELAGMFCKYRRLSPSQYVSKLLSASMYNEIVHEAVVSSARVWVALMANTAGSARQTATITLSDAPLSLSFICSPPRGQSSYRPLGGEWSFEYLGSE